MILLCGLCSHAGQGKMYGTYMRVFNKAKTKNMNDHPYRCTVCGSIRTIQGKVEEKAVEPKGKGSKKKTV